MCRTSPPPEIQEPRAGCRLVALKIKPLSSPLFSSFPQPPLPACHPRHAGRLLLLLLLLLLLFSVPPAPQFHPSLPGSRFWGDGQVDRSPQVSAGHWRFAGSPQTHLPLGGREHPHIRPPSARAPGRPLRYSRRRAPLPAPPRSLSQAERARPGSGGGARSAPPSSAVPAACPPAH